MDGEAKSACLMTLREHDGYRTEKEDGEEAPEHSEKERREGGRRLASISQSKLRLSEVVTSATEGSWVPRTGGTEEGGFFELLMLNSTCSLKNKNLPL